MKFNIVEQEASENDRFIFQKIAENNVNDFFEKLASNISISKIVENIFIQHNLKGFETDFFYIVKPNQRKSWHRAKAHEDLVDIRKKINQAGRKKILQQNS